MERQEVFPLLFYCICDDIWSDPEKTTVKGLEENGSGTGLYGGCSWDWNGISAGSRKDTWSYLTFAYIFMAAVLPMWLLMQPRII